MYHLNTEMMTTIFVGFDIDLAQYIADKLGVDMEVTDMEFQSIVPSIQNGGV